MENPEHHAPFGDRLQAQETRVGEAQLAAYRRSLDKRFAQAARHERQMRVALFILFAIVALGMLLPSLASQAIPALFPKVKVDDLMEQNNVAFAVGIGLLCIFAASGLCLPPFLLLYFLRYRRRLQQIWQDQVLAAVLDLQRELAELRARLGRPPGPPGKAPGAGESQEGIAE